MHSPGISVNALNRIARARAEVVRQVRQAIAAEAQRQWRAGA